MAASEVLICNLALSRLGLYRIQSLNDASKEARECKLHYPVVRDAVLEDHDWDFARKRTVLALLVDTFTNWDFGYQYPTDCIAAREILDPNGALSGTLYDSSTGTYVKTGRVEFEVIANAGLNGKVILTNKEDAELSYTARVEDGNMFSPAFVSAMAWKLAADLAIPLKGKPDLQISLMKIYIGEMSRAQTSSSNQGHKQPDNSSSFMTSRL